MALGDPPDVDPEHGGIPSDCRRQIPAGPTAPLPLDQRAPSHLSWNHHTRRPYIAPKIRHLLRERSTRYYPELSEIGNPAGPWGEHPPTRACSGFSPLRRRRRHGVQPGQTPLPSTPPISPQRPEPIASAGLLTPIASRASAQEPSPACAYPQHQGPPSLRGPRGIAPIGGPGGVGAGRDCSLHRPPSSATLLVTPTTPTLTLCPDPSDPRAGFPSAPPPHPPA